MNTFQELNNFSNQQIEFLDYRVPNIIFDRDTPTNQTISVVEGSTHTVPVGLNILEVVNSPANLTTYTLIVGNAPGTTVNWPVVPAGCQVTNPSTGVYVISGVDSAAIWEQIKSPTIILPNNYFGEFTYTATVTYKNLAATNGWIVSVAVTEVEALTNPLSIKFDPSTTYSPLASTPRVVDEGPVTPIWTVTLTPSITLAVVSLASAGTGGSSSFNNSTKVLTISGTKTQVNSHLAAITLVTSSAETDFVITYYASNNLNAETATKTQNFLSSAIQFLGAVRGVIYYNEDTVTAVSNGPLVTDIDYDGSGTYSLVVSAVPTTAVSVMSATGTGGSAVWNGTAKTLTITGTRTQVNSYIDNISMTPAGDYNQNFTLSYALTTPRPDQATKLQPLLIGSLNTEVTNMNESRTYVGNNENTLFTTNIPFISDADTASGLIYTIYLSCVFGEFATLSPATSPSYNWSYTGTKAEINAIFSKIKFYPDLNAFSLGFDTGSVFTYKQYKNGVLQVEQDVSLTGSAGTLPTSIVTFTASQTWTPTYAFVKYGKVDLLIVGGGGGGAAYGAGGGAGQVKEIFDITLTPGSKSIIIGSGGAGGTGGYSSIGISGASSSALGYTCDGGSGGRKNVTSVPYPPVNGWLVYTANNPGGGSGGGGTSGGTYNYTGPGTPPVGFNTAVYNYGGGGGGAGGSGANGVPGSSSGKGGNAILSTITNQYYSSGGNGWGNNDAKLGIYGNGGNSPSPGSAGQSGQNGYVYIKITG